MILNQARGTVLASHTRWARDPLTRLIGLMGRRALPAHEALIFPGVKSVHTHFMRFAIDVLFYDRDLVALRLVRVLPPWRFSPYARRAAGVIELPAGTLRMTRTEPGDQLQFAD